MEDERLSGRIIIDTVLANMREQVEELRYSKVVPAAYDVYLHADDQQRFESLASEIAAEAVRALEERLDTLNRPSRLDRVRGVVGKRRVPYKKVGPWLVRIARDPEGSVPRGRALVISQMAIAGADSFEGQRTRRLATLSGPAEAEHDSTAASRPAAHAAPGAPALAVLAWEDEAGPHSFPVTGHEVTVGRAVRGSTADARLRTVPDVSRLHFRLRYHPDDQRFSIEDLSLLGTTVNGQTLERGSPHDLPSPAEIRLADAITLRFERSGVS